MKCMRWGFWAVLLFCTRGLAEELSTAADEPVDRAFVQQLAQTYYDALAKKDFDFTARREVFVLQIQTPDLAAYRNAMEKHPYAGAERIECSVADIDSSRAYLDLKILRNGSTLEKRATWSRTGTPRTWVVEMTRMTMAGMPGYEIIAEDAPPPAREAVVKSTAVVRDRNLQEGTIAPGTIGPVRFVRPPKVMPAGKIGATAYVLGSIENTGEAAVAGVVIKVVVRSEDGAVLETRELRPAKPLIAAGATVQFSGTLDHLAPKQTEFSLALPDAVGGATP